MNDTEKSMYEFAYALTQSAGGKLKRIRRGAGIEAREKTSQMDLVTEQDILIEKYLVNAILEKYGDHSILAEENHKKVEKNESGYRWIIDPIDGTVNYYRFAKDYSVSVALYRDEAPVFGIVFDVANNAMFSGRNNEDSLMDGYRMSRMDNEKKSLDKAVVSMSLRTMMEFGSMGMDVFGMLSKVQAHRSLGCASLDLCRVAKGEYDLYLSSSIHEWDIAAARVLLEQCGGFLISCEKDADCPAD